MGEKKSNVKKRNWAFVLYPESAPENWRDILQDTGLPCAISPLHEFDSDPNGEVKKAHFHVIICYSGPTSFNVVHHLTASLNQPIPQALEAVRGYYRYFTHKDNPDKYQYDELDITTLNGFNILDFTEITRSEILATKSRLTLLIQQHGFTEYKEFMDFVMSSGTQLEFDVASSNTLYFNAYLRSSRYGD